MDWIGDGRKRKKEFLFEENKIKSGLCVVKGDQSIGSYNQLTRHACKILCLLTLDCNHIKISCEASASINFTDSRS
jgi:hypothetical protein